MRRAARASRATHAGRAGRRTRASLSALATLGSLALIGACAPAAYSPGSPSFSSADRTGLGISPLRHTPYAGTSFPLAVTGDDAGRERPDVTWTTRPLHRAWVTSDGVAHFFEPGPVRVIARSAEGIAATDLEIRPNPVVELQAWRTYGGPVFPGDSVRIAARPLDDDDREIDDVATAFAVDVRGEERAWATVTADGIFVAERPGLYTVLVEANSRAATVPVLVRAEPAEHAGRSVRAHEHSDLDSMARRAPRLAPVIVSPVRTRRVSMHSPDFTAYTGTSMRLEASVWREGSRDPDTSAVVAWSSSDTSIAIVDADGFVSFRRRGWVKLTARHDDVTSTRRLLVRRNLAAHMVLQSNADYPRVGQPIRLTEEAWAYGAMKIPHARAYFGIVSHGDASPAASISDDRVFVAREPGAYTIIAVLGGRASKTTFVVYPRGPRCELALRKWDPSCQP